jgi:hypothetical protein
VAIVELTEKASFYLEGRFCFPCSTMKLRLNPPCAAPQTVGNSATVAELVLNATALRRAALPYP